MLNFSYNILSMKIAIVIPVLCFAVSAAVAQQQTPKALLEIIKEHKAEKIKTPAEIPNKVTLSSQKAKLLAVTSKGRIYGLPLDNMPCFVPYKITVPEIPLGWRTGDCYSRKIKPPFKMESIIPERTKEPIAFRNRIDQPYIIPYSITK